MTAIERTAYPRFTRAPSVKELREIYTPTPAEKQLWVKAMLPVQDEMASRVKKETIAAMKAAVEGKSQ